MQDGLADLTSPAVPRRLLGQRRLSPGSTNAAAPAAVQCAVDPCQDTCAPRAIFKVAVKLIQRGKQRLAAICRETSMETLYL